MFWDCGFPNKYCLFFYYYNPVLKKYTASKRFKCAIKNAFMVDNYPVLECILSNHFPYELFEPCCTIKDDNINNSITIFEKSLISFNLENIKETHRKLEKIRLRFHIDKDKVCSYRHEFGLLHHLLYYFKHSESNVRFIDVKDIKWLWDNYQDHL